MADSEVHRSEGGTLELSHVARNTVYSKVVGKLDGDLYPFLLRFCDDVLERESGPLVSFHEWLQMTGYASAARVELTRWNLERRHRIEAVHILSSSKLVRMGVAVAGMALPALVAHADSLSFNRAMLARTGRIG